MNNSFPEAEVAHGRQVCFVADPAQASEGEVVYARPDDPSDAGPTWREVVRRYNEGDGGNPLGLLPAHALYHESVYQGLAEHVGLERFYILSAGWGLISATFPTPYYDITLTAKADAYKRRRKSDMYLDFCMLPANSIEPIVFFGSSEYVPPVCTPDRRDQGSEGSLLALATRRGSAGISIVRFNRRRSTNWQYDCVNAFLDGKLEVPFSSQS